MQALGITVADLRSARTNPQRVPPALLVRFGRLLEERGRGMARFGRFMMRRAARAVLVAAVRGRRDRGGPWGEAALAEFDQTTGRWEAVRWAARLAGRLGCPLHVVRTWSISSAPRPSTAEPGSVPPLSDFEAAVLQHLESDHLVLDSSLNRRVVTFIDGRDPSVPFLASQEWSSGRRYSTGHCSPLDW